MFELELQVAETLARAAGLLALTLQGSGEIIEKPNSEGPVTQGDLQADQLITEGLRKYFQKDLIISEETYVADTTVPGTGRVWFVDPIDGTQEYAAGGTEYAVMIGLSIDSIPTVGVVYEPATGNLWRARPGKAQRVTNSNLVIDLDIKNKPIPSDGPVLAVSHSHASRFLDFLTAQLPVSKIIKKSSVGLKIALIADGQADAYISAAKRIKLWDTCAPAAILTASGGTFRAFQGHLLPFSGNIRHGIEIIATTPHAEDWFQGKLQRVIEEWIALRKTETRSY